MTEEVFPVSEVIEVIDGKTIFKSDKWWSAVLLVNSFGRREISIYLWLWDKDAWKRMQKFAVRSQADWEKYREAVESFLFEL